MINIHRYEAHHHKSDSLREIEKSLHTAAWNFKSEHTQATTKSVRQENLLEGARPPQSHRSPDVDRSEFLDFIKRELRIVDTAAVNEILQHAGFKDNSSIKLNRRNIEKLAKAIDEYTHSEEASPGAVQPTRPPSAPSRLATPHNPSPRKTPRGSKRPPAGRDPSLHP